MHTINHLLNNLVTKDQIKRTRWWIPSLHKSHMEFLFYVFPCNFCFFHFLVLFLSDLRLELISHSTRLLSTVGIHNNVFFFCLGMCFSTEPAITGKEAVLCCQSNGCLLRPLWRESLPRKQIHGERWNIITYLLRVLSYAIATSLFFAL